MLLDIRPSSVPPLLFGADGSHWPVCWIFENRIGSSSASIPRATREHSLNSMVALSTNSVQSLDSLICLPYPPVFAT